MEQTIEIRAFMGLAEVFRQRHWPTPYDFPVEAAMTGPELLAALDIAASAVEVVFVNRKAYALDCARIHPGDRVALVPPGVPGPHRFLLGFKNRD